MSRRHKVSPGILFWEAGDSQLGGSYVRRLSLCTRSSLQGPPRSVLSAPGYYTQNAAQEQGLDSKGTNYYELCSPILNHTNNWVRLLPLNWEASRNPSPPLTMTSEKDIKRGESVSIGLTPMPVCRQIRRTKPRKGKTRWRILVSYFHVITEITVEA